MFKMEINSPSTDKIQPLSPQNYIIQRLGAQGVPREYLERLQPGLVVYYKENKSQLPSLVSALLPTDDSEYIQEAHFHESMIWLQWLMFERDPGPVLKDLAELSVGQRGVCGAVWGNNDIAYRCRTCEHDPTCAICVPCFQNGNHKDHDYSIIYTGGGCCDCGDVTAWKRQGFCSKHKGTEQIQPLPQELADSVGPVLDFLFTFWKSSLSAAGNVYLGSSREDDHLEEMKISDFLASSMVQMLLDFCNCSESLLSFISERVLSSVGLLGILVKAEMFLREDDVSKLHSLLLKMLSEPLFKFEFAKVFLDYYPTIVSKAIKECNDGVYKNHPLLSTFAVQIFTVPTLTPLLVKERNLLVLLVECLGTIFCSCAGENGRLEVNKWINLYETTMRVVEDARFVMSHAVVPKYVTHDRRDILKIWMKLLAFMQGMNPQKRETGIHIEEANENMHLPFVMGHSIANIHSLLVAGGFSESRGEENDGDNLFDTYRNYHDRDTPRQAKVGKHSEESSVSSATGRNSISDLTSGVTDIKSGILLSQPAVSCLTNECLKSIESWLRMDNTSGNLHKTANMLGNNFTAFKKTLSKFRRGNSLLRSYDASYNSTIWKSINEIEGRHRSSTVQNGENGNPAGIDLPCERVIEQGASSTGLEENTIETEYVAEDEALHVLSLAEWPNISYDVSLQDISVHIPLHRLLSMILQRAARKCYGELNFPNTLSTSSPDPSSLVSQDFFGNVLRGCHPHGFSAFVMEHPLRIRVFCAQVHAGMWRRNGDAPNLSCEWYRSVRWSEQGLELDLFLLQCCAALAPADRYVSRFLERFGLSDYLTLNVERFSEYEPVLMQEMLSLIIQIVKERRFCGLSSVACLQRELIYKLAIGNATRSQLVKSLPRDLSKNDCLQEILDKVAVYSNPSGIKQGMYKLRLEFWKQLDLYHPRWNSRDLQVAEERYLRFCQASALTSQLPKWTSIYEPFDGIARIATCKVVLEIIRAVLFYAVHTNKSVATRATDSVLLTALHLLSLALDICFQKKEYGDRLGSAGDSFPLLAFAGQEIYTRHANGSSHESLLSLLVASLKMHQKERSDNFLEAGSFNFSSLIEVMLKKLAELDPGCMTKLQKLAPEVVSHLSHPSFCSGAYQGGLVSEVDKRKAKARERQAAILQKMRSQQSKFLENINSTASEDLDGLKSGESSPLDTGIEAEESSQDVCSLCHDSNSQQSLCFLILLQKSRLLSLVDRGPPSWKDICCSDKEHLPEISPPSDSNMLANDSGQISSPRFGQLIQSAVDELASDGHPREVNAFVEFIKAKFPSFRSIQLPSTLQNASERTASSIEKLEEHIYFAIRERMRDSISHSDILERGHRLPMMEENLKGGVGESLLLGKYISTLSKGTTENSLVSGSTSSQTVGPSESSKKLSPYHGFGPVNCDGIHVSSCGHAVHKECLDRYLLSMRERYLRRVAFEGGHIVDPDLGEFLCPVCRGFANSVLPAIRGDSQKLFKQPRDSVMRCLDSTRSSTSENKEIEKLFLQEALSLLHSAADVVGRNEVIRAFPTDQIGSTSPNLESVFRVLSGMYFPKKKDKTSGSERVSNHMLMWDTLRYSLISTEISSRSRRASLAPNLSLEALFNEPNSSKGFVLSLLLKNLQGTRSSNSVTVLLRLRGIQLFAESICSGASFDDFAGHSLKQGGNMSTILKKLGREVPYPDIEFWRRASNPILSSDAFSSFMWVLFCLPSQFLSSDNSFVSLVHLFYGVSIAQAIMTYFGKFQSYTRDVGCDGVLVTEIFNIMQESGIAPLYFISNHLDYSFDIKYMIRGLSFPYLRRCGLLWKVMNSSSSAPFSDGAHVWNSSSHSVDKVMEDVNGNNVEFAEAEALEKMFQIPPLDTVLNDEGLCLLVSRWLRHFVDKFEVRSAQTVLPMTPAVPFKLMHLPNVYQDLLQRYIKQNCPDCNSPLEEPALCLLCGKLCSPNWKICCRESLCQTHAVVCGAGIGVFLLVRKTTILLQRDARQAPWPSLYLDAFGEEDIDMNRGKLLYLNEERYASLSYMVASHGLDRNSLRRTTVGGILVV